MNSRCLSFRSIGMGAIYSNSGLKVRLGSLRQMNDNAGPRPVQFALSPPTPDVHSPQPASPKSASGEYRREGNQSLRRRGFESLFGLDRFRFTVDAGLVSVLSGTVGTTHSLAGAGEGRFARRSATGSIRIGVPVQPHLSQVGRSQSVSGSSVRDPRSGDKR